MTPSLLTKCHSSSDQNNGERTKTIVLDFLFTQSDTVDESIEYCITEHVREVLAHDPLVEVKFVKKFSWE